MANADSKIDEYIRLAELWGAAMRDEDPDHSNSLHDRIQVVFSEISRMNQEEALFDRAEDVDEAARFFIASHLKQKDRTKARELYRQLSQSTEPFISISAEYILRELE